MKEKKKDSTSARDTSRRPHCRVSARGHPISSDASRSQAIVHFRSTIPGIVGPSKALLHIAVSASTRLDADFLKKYENKMDQRTDRRSFIKDLPQNCFAMQYRLARVRLENEWGERAAVSTTRQPIYDQRKSLERRVYTTFLQYRSFCSQNVAGMKNKQRNLSICGIFEN
ncbi:hypothetical protein EVAR_51117_1 [Eumeta japonica]|uniref:Uncharacterized protein n=1 Tax=Eumeta variegata TaxID=151549 RepID=A0A4C1YAZ9_EUMVA|nr:hypothetical protein EVAR_51117_1 [Eumeta japonica]